MDAWRYGIYLLVFTFDISPFRFAHSFDIDVNTRREIPYLRASMYYSLCNDIFFVCSFQITVIGTT